MYEYDKVKRTTELQRKTRKKVRKGGRTVEEGLKEVNRG